MYYHSTGTDNETSRLCADGDASRGTPYTAKSYWNANAAPGVKSAEYAYILVML
jgi:hypothetical protein